ncbi:MAG TPA: DUF3604 domain-containing protein [Acidobacteriota bacterium]
MENASRALGRQIVLWLVAASLFSDLASRQRLNSERVTITPNHAVAGQFGSWTVTYHVGPDGIKKGGGIRTQLPDSWHSGIRNSAKRLQATDPAADHFVSARASRGDVRLKTIVESEPERAEWLVKAPRRSLDGRFERYVFVVRVEVLEGALKEGDTLSVIYGDTSQGSRGMEAAIISTRPEPVLVALNTEGAADFKLLPDRPTIVAYGGPATELMVIGPSNLVMGRPAQLRLSVVDANSNPARDFDDEIILQMDQDKVSGPSRIPFSKSQPWQTVTVVPAREGVIRIAASGMKSGLRTVSNPMKVFAQEPPLKIYWGDLHSHTRYSWDGVGEGNFEYARDISGLEFYAMTDHSRIARGGFTQGLGKHVWDEYVQLTDRYYQPKQFVTIHAYEASFGSPYGHHNVFFRGRPGPLLSSEAVTLPELWKALTAGQALTIPHHTGKMPPVVDFSYHDPELRRNFEIYSGHGLSEAYDPIHALAFEQSLFTGPASSSPGPKFAQDVWMRGLILSTIAASDDHRAHPGQPHWGLAAVAASGLTREEIFDALYERRTYGTTGARILLDFSINTTPMGRQVTAQGPVRLKLEAHGTATVELAEILRYSASDKKFRVIYSFKPGKLDFQWEGTDEAFREDSIYYARLRQAGFIRDRIAMAWSSPIWVKKR